jgi:8-oxo-dGTP diphosphatase
VTIFAAGAILWRESKGELQVAVIHRSRHNDWSWPKGKVDPGESLLETAVREIKEETGLSVKLGPQLKIVHYKVPSGEPKEVHYWSARVSDSALAKSTFMPSEEVAKVDWYTPAAVRKMLTYEFDREVLDVFLKLEKSGQLHTKPIVVLRHAKATPRTDWFGGKGIEESTRPLLPAGLSQAERLTPALAAFGIKRVFTSPWLRCLSTVKPYADSRNLKIIERSQLSELGNKKGPKRTKNVIHDIVLDGRASIICSHRPALPTILASLGEHADAHHAAVLQTVADLKPAEFAVAHLTKKVPGKSRRVVSVERYQAEPPVANDSKSAIA